MILDDALRHAAVNHPPTTVAGVRNQMAGVEQQLLTMRSDEGHGCLEFVVQASDEPAWAVGRESAAVLAALFESPCACELVTLRDTAGHTGPRHAAMFEHAQAARTLLAAPRRREGLEADGDAALDDATRSGTLYSVKGNCKYSVNMLQFPSISSKLPSHFAMVDSGASIYILTCHRFLSDATANHSPVSSFTGSTSRATHTGPGFALGQLPCLQLYFYFVLFSAGNSVFFSMTHILRLVIACCSFFSFEMVSCFVSHLWMALAM